MTLTKFLVITATAIGLSGCFVSKTPLIGEDKSVAPYQTIAYTQDGEDKTTTLTREGTAYLIRAEGNEAEIRFTDVGDGAFVAQLRSKTEAGSPILYAFLQVDLATRTAQGYKIVAKDEDAGAGLSRCSTSEEEICIESIEAYADYARKAIAAGEEPETTYDIVTLE